MIMKKFVNMAMSLPQKRCYSGVQSSGIYISERSKGEVVFYSFKKKYGFVHDEDMEQDIFFSCSEIQGKIKQDLEAHEMIEYDVVRTLTGLEAKNILSLGPSNWSPVDGAYFKYPDHHLKSPAKWETAPEYYTKIRGNNSMYGIQT